MSSFVSNMVDKDGNAIDCDYYLFHYETGNMSDVHTTENQQVSIDSEDSDVDGNGVVFAEGDTAILYCYTDNACCVVRIISDGSDSYTQPMQLLDCQAPTATMILTEADVNAEVTAISTSSDEYQWEYEGTTHYHKASWYGKDWCDVGIAKVEYDWGDGWTEDTSHVYSSSDEYEVGIRVTNNCGLVTESSDTVKVYWREPKVELISTSTTPIVNEEITINSNIEDPDSVVVSNTYYLNDAEIDELTMSFAELGTHIVKLVTVWNDGFEDKQIITELEIKLDNQNPNLNPEITNEDNIYRIVANAEDPEDRLDSTLINVYIDSNTALDGDDYYDWVLLKSNTFTEQLMVNFVSSGVYKIELIARDLDGGQSEVYEKVITIECTGIDVQIVEKYITPATQVADITTADKYFVNTGSLVTGDIDIMNVNGAIDIVEVSGNVEIVDTNGYIENKIELS